MDAPAPALSHSAGTFYLRTCKRDGKLSQHAPGCACWSGRDEQREQAKIVRKEGWRLSTQRKQQCDTGRIQAMEYFDNIKEERLTWEGVLFNDGKVDSYNKNGLNIHVIVKKNLCEYNSKKLGDIF